MKSLFLSSLLCVCFLTSNAQLSLSDTNSDQQSNSVISGDRIVAGYYPGGNKQYEGYRRKEELHGRWLSWYDNGQQADAGSMQKGIPDGKWMAWYTNGEPRFIRTYSFDKWQQFQNEKSRYHPKKVSMPITTVFHENKKQAEKYTTAINSFCAKQNCVRTNEGLQQTIDNDTAQEHYHPVFQEGLLHGPFVNYFPGGTVKDSGQYKNGLPEGLWIKWTDDKQFYWEGYYHHGLKNKEWKLYSANNKLIRIVSYRQGKYLWRKDIKEEVGITIGDID